MVVIEWFTLSPLILYSSRSELSENFCHDELYEFMCRSITDVYSKFDEAYVPV